MNVKKKLLIAVLFSLMLIVGVAFAYIHYVVQIDNTFTIGADYLADVRVSAWTPQETCDFFGVQHGELLGRGIGAPLYWGEMLHGSKWSPILNITNTSPDKIENITWIAVDLPSGMELNAYLASELGSTGVQWIPNSGHTLQIGESFNVVFDLRKIGAIADGTFGFDIDVRCEDA